MRLALALVLSLPLAAHAAAPRATYRVHDLTPTFWAYWDEARDLPAEEQVRLFEERVVARHPDVYTARVLGLDPDVPLRAALRERWPKFLAFVGAQLPLARKLSASVGHELPRYDARFREAFPDFAYTGDVYFLVSVGAFDGGTRPVRGRTALLFGVDVIARVYGEEADPESFFDHELFHLYHHQFPDPLLEGTLGRSLWTEGLAVYVADRLNPGTPAAVLFGLPRDTPERVRANLPAYAREMRQKLLLRSPEEEKRWFQGSGDGTDFPGRAGYTLGYLVAREVARGKSLRQLARLRGKALRRELERALDTLAARR